MPPFCFAVLVGTAQVGHFPFFFILKLANCTPCKWEEDCDLNVGGQTSLFCLFTIVNLVWKHSYNRASMKQEISDQLHDVCGWL